MISRRTVLGGLAALGGVAGRPGRSAAQLAPSQAPLAVRYGWDEAVEGPTLATLYVAPDGDDAAEGSLDRPLRTIQRGVDLLAGHGGGSLSIRGGTYREEVSLGALRGTPDAPLRIHRHGRERVTITAAEVLVGWEPCGPTDADELGIPVDGLFVTSLPRERLAHGTPFALNLHERGRWCPIATDRADTTDPARAGDHRTFHWAQFALDAEERILAIRDPRLRGVPAARLRQAGVLLHHFPNATSRVAISAFDGDTGTIVLADPTRRLQGTVEEPVMLYALENAPGSLGEGQWVARERSDGTIAIFFRPRDPASLDGGVEASLRPACIDLGAASFVELLGLEAVRAAGGNDRSGICIRGLALAGAGEGLRLVHCRAGESLSAGADGSGTFHLRQARRLVLDHVSIGPSRGDFGLALAGCEDVDMRFLHVDGVTFSPARFFGLKRAVLAFSLFENGGTDSHANKFNFYEGSDQVLVYGVRTRNVGGYATYQEASRIHFAFCEIESDPGSYNRALVSQNRSPGADQGGADGSGDPVAGGTFWYWNLSLLARPRTAEPANALALGPGSGSQRHRVHNCVLNGGGVGEIYADGTPPDREVRSHNHYTGLAWWQQGGHGWRLGPGEAVTGFRLRPVGAGLDMRPLIAREVAPLFPGFSHWDLDIDGNPVNWDAAPVGCHADG